MNEKKELGKIHSVTIGACGYDEAMFGIKFVLGGPGWGVVKEITGGWDMEPTARHSWTAEDRTRGIGKAFDELRVMMKSFNVTDVNQLVGKPIEATFIDNAILNFRPLLEVM